MSVLLVQSMSLQMTSWKTSPAGRSSLPGNGTERVISPPRLVPVKQGYKKRSKLLEGGTCFEFM